jgi:hypothetical protein
MQEPSTDKTAPLMAAIEPPSLDQIVLSVLAWQRQHPLSKRLGPESVHSVGWVALPFLRTAHSEAGSATLPLWRRAASRWLRRSSQAAPDAIAAFSENFIDGVKPGSAADFALRYGIDTLPAGDDWPQRRIAVDADRTGSEAAGWPFERWVASAALDGPGGRRRVLVGARGQGNALAVLGRRHWDRARLAAAGALPALGLAALAWVVQAPEPEVPEVRVVGAVLAASGVRAALPIPASAPSGAVAASAAPQAASAAASSPEPPASAASQPEAAASRMTEASTSPPSGEAAGLPRIDIRPRLGPLREGDRPRPPLRAGPSAAPSPTAPSANAASGPVAERPGAANSVGNATTPASQPVVAESSGRVELRSSIPGAATIALVSPGYAQRAEAQAMLSRIQEHLRATAGAGKALEGAVFESPQGYRAAVWPFASREEAQLLNATMIARGWRTRAMDF